MEIDVAKTEFTRLNDVLADRRHPLDSQWSAVTYHGSPAALRR